MSCTFLDTTDFPSGRSCMICFYFICVCILYRPRWSRSTTSMNGIDSLISSTLMETLSSSADAEMHSHHHHHHLSLNRDGRCGTTDDFATSSLLFSLFSTAHWDLRNSRPVHSPMLSSHLFLCLTCLLPPFTVPFKMVLARPDERET